MEKKMNPFLIRSRQAFLKGVALFAPFKVPEKYVGEGSINEINHILLHKDNQVHNCLIVTGPRIIKTNLIGPLTDNLNRNGIEYSFFNNIQNNPTKDNVEEGALIYKERNCEGIIAIGGGSVIDTAKCILARVSNPKTPLENMKGMFKIKNKLPLLVAIPTTCGSGSESTFSAVILDEKNNEKYIITDFKLLPKYIILDPNLLMSLDNDNLAYSGMDALCHAIEAFVSRSSSSNSNKYAIEAIKLINSNLEIISTKDGRKNLKACENMLIASHYAGLAVSRAYVGYIHAIAHALGGKYNLSHGYLNAILMPIVLEAYGNKAIRKLAILADEITYLFDDKEENKAKWMIDRIRHLNTYLGIKNDLGKYIKDEDIDAIAMKAYDEVTPLYPVPKLFTIEEIKDIINTVKKQSI